jgi:hypothetical protein
VSDVYDLMAHPYSLDRRVNLCSFFLNYGKMRLIEGYFYSFKIILCLIRYDETRQPFQTYTAFPADAFHSCPVGEYMQEQVL